MPSTYVIAVQDAIASTKRVEFSFRFSAALLNFHQELCGVRVDTFSVKLMKAVLILLTSALEGFFEVDLKPSTERPSSVNVPVLSKTKVVIWPAMLIRGGDMQKMSCFLRRLIAKTIPQDMAAGRAGGTVTVNKSSVRSIMIAKGTPSWT